jgi:hypothetical protein
MSVTNFRRYSLKGGFVKGSEFADIPYVAPAPPISPILTDLLYLLDASNSTSWPGSGTTWFDISGQSNNATLVNGLTYSTAGGAPSMFFDGTNDYATFGAGGVPQPSLPITWNFWYKSGTSIPYQPDGLFDTGPSLANVMRVINDNAYTGTTNFPTVEWSGQNPTIPLQGYNVSDWNQYTFVYNFSTNRSIKFYINGILVATATGNTTSSLSWTEVVLGAINKNAFWLNGWMNNAALYSVELNSTQITQNYNAYSPRFTNTVTYQTGSLGFYYDAQVLNSNNGQGTTWWNVAPNTNSGSLLNGAAFTSGTPKYVALDGTNDYVTSGDKFDPISAFTVAGWFYGTNLVGQEAKPIIAKWADTGNNRSVLFSHNTFNDTSGVGLLVDRDGAFGDTKYASQGSQLSNNQWYYLAATYDGANISVYVNGAVTGSNSYLTSGSLYSGTADIRTGADGNGRYWPGRVGAVQWYTSSLQASQILSNFNNTKATYGY